MHDGQEWMVNSKKIKPLGTVWSYSGIETISISHLVIWNMCELFSKGNRVGHEGRGGDGTVK